MTLITFNSVAADSPTLSPAGAGMQRRLGVLR